jgi:hypothetical protein
MTNPWLKFSPTAWRSDTRLRLCSPAARGLWIELICVMHECEPYGHLLPGGKNPDHRAIAKLTGIAPQTCFKLLAELEKNQVFSLTNSYVIFSRRMVRDHQNSLRDKDNGKLGGNPNIPRGVNPDLKAKNLEERIKKKERIPPTPQGARSRSSPVVQLPKDFTLTAERAESAKACGLDPVSTFKSFCEWFWMSGKKYARWDTRWTMWCADQMKKKSGDAPPITVTYGDDGLPRYGTRH